MLIFWAIYICRSLHIYTCIYIYMIWYDMIWYDMIWYDMIWYDMIWYDMIWYDMICIYNQNSPYNDAKYNCIDFLLYGILLRMDRMTTEHCLFDHDTFFSVQAKASEDVKGESGFHEILYAHPPFWRRSQTVGETSCLICFTICVIIV